VKSSLEDSNKNIKTDQQNKKFVQYKNKIKTIKEYAYQMFQLATVNVEKTGLT